MSVAEALGVDARLSGVRTGRPRNYHGLRLGDSETFQRETSRRRDDNSDDGRHEAINYPAFGGFSKQTGTAFNDRQLYMSGVSDPRLAGEDRQRSRDNHVQGGIHGQEFLMKTNDRGFVMDTKGNAGFPTTTVSRFPSHLEPHSSSAQQQFQLCPASPMSQRMTPQEMEEYRNKLGEISHEKKIAKEQWVADDMKQAPLELGNGKHEQWFPFMPSDNRANFNANEWRSLDLESSKGGAGAPVKDPWGKNVTRLPITLRRDDYGESVMKEDIPGKATFNLDFTNEESKPYYPWESPGGGAPIRDKNGKIITQVYGKLEGKIGTESEIWRSKRRQEMLNNELKECMRQQKENKEEFSRYMKAPQEELAQVLLAGRVGKPRRDEITGEIVHQHLPNSDVSRLKMNYQPVPLPEKKRYYDELVRMAEERQYQKQLEKLKERQEANAHFQNMDSAWGAFGGGAPKHQVIRKKANLMNSLFYPQHSLGGDYIRSENYLPPTGLGSFEYIQSSHAGYQNTETDAHKGDNLLASNCSLPTQTTSRSSHKNLFDTVPGKDTKGPGGYCLAPYATGRSYE
ncbi:hypothetical protein BsWGS_25621 [Bradybaena similaris]